MNMGKSLFGRLSEQDVKGKNLIHYSVFLSVDTIYSAMWPINYLSGQTGSSSLY